MIREAHRALLARWRTRFLALPAPARAALREALLDLRHDCLARARHLWSRHKCTSAWYARIVAVYAGHLAAALREPSPRLPPSPRP